MENTTKIKVALVGCGRMGKQQATFLSSMEEYSLSAVCDISEEKAETFAKEFNTKYYTNFSEMLKKENPEAVVITTINSVHASQSIEAAKHKSVKGVYCEKPMATNMKDAKMMREVCLVEGVALVINHQRRIGDDLIRAKEIIDSGEIGNIQIVRGNCSGDILSDGTHLFDSMLFLSSDVEVDNVLGQVYMGKEEDRIFRFGHAVEKGSMSIINLKNGIRLEAFTGESKKQYSAYQDYEIVGSKGRIWRCGDKSIPDNLFISTGKEGTYKTDLVDWQMSPVFCGEGEWKKVTYDCKTVSNIEKGFRYFAESIREGKKHPMNADIAIRGFEIVMATYESARTNSKIALPLKQEEFPLELMIKKK